MIIRPHGFAIWEHTQRALDDRIKATGAKLIAFAPALSLAKKLIRSGADAIVIEGMEAGGHIGPVSTSVLAQEFLPALADEHIVFVAGGIGRGEAIAGYLEMGAVGVQLGTRFVCAHECIAHPNFKKAFIRASARDAIPSVQIDPRLPVIPLLLPQQTLVRQRGHTIYKIQRQITIGVAHRRREIDLVPRSERRTDVALEPVRSEERRERREAHRVDLRELALLALGGDLREALADAEARGHAPEVALAHDQVARLDPAGGFDDFVLCPFVPSELYARNVSALLELMLDESGAVAPDWDDEVLAKSALNKVPGQSATTRRARRAKVGTARPTLLMLIATGEVAGGRDRPAIT